MNYERMMYSGDLSAPVWAELPKPIIGARSEATASRNADSRDERPAAPPSNGAGVAELVDAPEAGDNTPGVAGSNPAAAPPFAVGDRVMVDGIAPRYVMAVDDKGWPTRHHMDQTAPESAWSGGLFHYAYRHPTPAELSEHWGEWIPHDGGPCPVPNGTSVDVRFRDGKEEYGQMSTPEIWPNIPDAPDLDITHYKVIA